MEKKESALLDGLMFLGEFLEDAAAEKRREATEDVSDWIQGMDTGEALAFELCCKWVRDLISRA